MNSVSTSIVKSAVRQCCRFISGLSVWLLSSFCLFLCQYYLYLPWFLCFCRKVWNRQVWVLQFCSTCFWLLWVSCISPWILECLSISAKIVAGSLLRMYQICSIKEDHWHPKILSFSPWPRATYWSAVSWNTWSDFTVRVTPASPNDCSFLFCA